jgi:microcystin-dependent protein
MSTIFPGSASVGQIYEGYTFNGIAWDLIGNEFNPTSFSSSAPLNPKAGDLWVDSDEDVDIIDDQNLVFQNDLNDYLSLSSASSTYLSQTNASDTYISKISASTTYLSQSSASDIYLSQLSASTNYATKAYADNSSSAAAAALIDAAPSTLNTLNELAAALGDDPNFATTVTNALSPIGSVTAFALATPPAGWLLCDGSIYSASAYPTLSVGLGSTYGGNGTTTFAVPNLKGRMPVGIDSAQTEFDARGETGGVKDVTLTAAQSGVPLHSHSNTATVSITGGAHAHGLPLGLAGAQGVDDIAYRSGNAPDPNFRTGTETTGSGYGAGYATHTHSGTVSVTNVNNTAANAASAHTNLQPYIVMNYIIRAV